jgi:hypothetical protein
LKLRVGTSRFSTMRVFLFCTRPSSPPSRSDEANILALVFSAGPGWKMGHAGRRLFLGRLIAGRYPPFELAHRARGLAKAELGVSGPLGVAKSSRSVGVDRAATAEVQARSLGGGEVANLGSNGLSSAEPYGRPCFSPLDYKGRIGFVRASHGVFAGEWSRVGLEQSALVAAPRVAPGIPGWVGQPH